MTQFKAVFFYTFAMLFCLTYQHKAIGQEGVRLLFYPGIFLLCLSIFYLSIKLMHQNGFIARLRFDQYTIPVFFLCLYFISSIQSAPLNRVLQIVFMNILPFLMLMCFAGYVSEKHFPHCIAQFFGGFAILFSVIALLMYIGILDIECGPFILARNELNFPRLHGSSGDPTSLGAAAGLGALAIYYLFSMQSNKKTYVVIGTVLVFFLLIVMVMAGSRNGLISFTSGIIVMKLWRFKSPHETVRFLLLMIGFSILGLIILLLLPPQIKEFLALVFRLKEDAMGQVRFELWDQALDLFYSSSLGDMFWGHGLGFLKANIRSSHNFYLDSLIDHGAIFIVLFIVYVVFLFRRLLRVRSTYYAGNSCFAVGLLTFSLVFAFFLNSLFTLFFYISNFAFLCSIVMISQLGVIRRTSQQTQFDHAGIITRRR